MVAAECGLLLTFTNLHTIFIVAEKLLFYVNKSEKQVNSNSYFPNTQQTLLILNLTHLPTLRSNSPIAVHFQAPDKVVSGHPASFAVITQTLHSALLLFGLV